MIGVYGENTKLAEFNEITADTISELKEIDVGLFCGNVKKYVAVKLVSVICEALARPNVRLPVNHSEQARCDRYVVFDRHLAG
ncbi:hypothetical protein Smp_063550 [Schistosoma mansoni]|uniref:hypothetical protein n=1 Tax=Schistosoma mansoni TaxID=6183 RepID=UPI0001A64266|nr:hypothetical protein Smp_063550 [Schistosoma mansoni]|eukprot:XP_018649253.1 hypothetical protein Smp_063550 [Schistosoma mansoni]